MSRKSVMLVAGARPNFMKVAPLYAALWKSSRFSVTLVHTGQHYDSQLSDVFFKDLNLPAPDVSLGVGSGTHAEQTARVLERFEPVLLERRPDLVVVVGDVNSTLACALAATKIVYPSGGRPLVAHVEAGLRSFDRSMPEEVNRVVTDQIADLLFTTEEGAAENLAREGVPRERIFFVGNVMIDTLLAQASRARELQAWSRFGLDERCYAVLTLHRPSNVDDPATFGRLLRAVRSVSAKMPVVFPVHPRTMARLEELGLAAEIASTEGLLPTAPLGYLEFISLLAGSALVLTDSGGIQEETTILGVPCVTLRETTERPITVTHGTNIIAGTDELRILDAVQRARFRTAPRPAPPGWDGRAADRIVAVLEQQLFAAPDQAGISGASSWHPLQPQPSPATRRPV